MALRFGLCPLCPERHALKSYGFMSIHTTGLGDRCPGTHSVPAAKPTLPVVARISLRRKTEHHSAAERNRERLREMDPDLKAAFEDAQYRRNKIDSGEPEKKAERVVYIVKGAHAVSGGLPTLGRNR